MTDGIGASILHMKKKTKFESMFYETKRDKRKIILPYVSDRRELFAGDFEVSVSYFIYL